MRDFEAVTFLPLLFAGSLPGGPIGAERYRGLIDPRNYKIVVVKLVYLFPELIALAAKALMALSPGASDLALARLPYQRIARPMFPVDQAFEWSP